MSLNSQASRAAPLMVILITVIVSPLMASEQPVGLFLTWQQDPTTTMTVDWHTTPDDEADPTLRYKEVGSDDWLEARARQSDFPYSDRTIHRVELTGLEPNTMYRFRTGEFARLYKFRTMPEDILENPVVFAAGGDTWRGSRMERTNRVAMQYDLDFIAWGGDLPYADGREDRVDLWYRWFESIRDTLVTEEGRVVPILAGIGNHEVRGGYYYGGGRSPDDYEDSDAFREEIAPYYYELIAFPGHPGWGVLDFGNYLSMVVLDSDHSNPIEGTQTQWLESVLAEREHFPHVMPLYHVPAFPSHRSYTGAVSTRVRENWVPLFEQHGVRVALENHDHTYKRTHPIRNEEVDPGGVVYIGDGAWGVTLREGDNCDEWYINRFASIRHAIIVTLHGPHQHFLMVSESGDVIDEYPRTPHSPLRGLDMAGDGSSDNPYQITNVGELQLMNENRQAHFILANDIDAAATAEWNNGAGFEPIGNGDHPFTGSFDGGGHTISDLSLDRADEDYVGLFGAASGDITNVVLHQPSAAGRRYVGALAGEPLANVENVRVIDTRVTGDRWVGGAAGRPRAIFRRVAVIGGSIEGDREVGGIAGRATARSSMYDCLSTAEVRGDRYVGGLTGHTSGVDSTFEAVYAAGPVHGNRDVSGLIGPGSDDEARAAYWDVDASGQQESVHGEPLRTEQMIGDTAERYMEGFDFESTWQVMDDDYPALRE